MKTPDYPITNSTLRRRTPLPKATAPMKRTRLKVRKVSKRFAKRRDQAWCAKIREMDCLLFDFWRPQACRGRTECAHVLSRGAGGYDRGNTVPLCTKHHREQHRIGIRSFEVRYGLYLSFRAARLAEEAA